MSQRACAFQLGRRMHPDQTLPSMLKDASSTFSTGSITRPIAVHSRTAKAPRGQSHFPLHQNSHASLRAGEAFTCAGYRSYPSNRESLTSAMQVARMSLESMWRALSGRGRRLRRRPLLHSMGAQTGITSSSACYTWSTLASEQQQQ